MDKKNFKTILIAVATAGAVALACFSIYRSMSNSVGSYSQAGIDDANRQVMAKSDKVNVLTPEMHAWVLAHSHGMGSKVH